MKAQCGFSLVEVLVSVFILAVGLLGLLALQSASLGYDVDGQSRSLAVGQVNDFADRMRANPVGVQNGNYNGLAVTGSTAGCSSTCTPAQIAQNDYNIWNTANANLFTSGSGTVTQISNNIYSITVYWDSHHTGATGTGCSGNYDVDLSCLTMQVSL